MQVRPVGVEAAAALARLHAAAFPAPWTAEQVASALASPFAFALEAGSPPVGFILAQAVAGEGEILTLAVDPAARRRGVGIALVRSAANLALAAGAETLWLEVAEDNAAALALYARAGFEAVGRRRDYYPGPQGRVDALTLRCRLNSAPA